PGDDPAFHPAAGPADAGANRSLIHIFIGGSWFPHRLPEAFLLSERGSPILLTRPHSTRRRNPPRGFRQGERHEACFEAVAGTARLSRTGTGSGRVRRRG